MITLSQDRSGDPGTDRTSRLRGLIGEVLPEPRRPRNEEGERARRHALERAVSPTREDDRHTPAEHDPGGSRVSEIVELLDEHVAALQVWDDEDVGMPGDLRNNPLYAGGRRGDCSIEGERSIHETAADLTAVCHLRQSGSFQR